MRLTSLKRASEGNVILDCFQNSISIDTIDNLGSHNLLGIEN
jgi:hypothetical protein